MTNDADSQTPDPASPNLMLIIFDDEDLAVVSAKFQDATVRVADIAYLPAEKRFALVAARFDWAASLHGRVERCMSGLHFDRVGKVAQIAIPRDDAEAVVTLLAIGFTSIDPPAGAVTLMFSNGAAIRLDVECLDAQMRDLGERWQVDSVPDTDLGFARRAMAPADESIEPPPGAGRRPEASRPR